MKANSPRFIHSATTALVFHKCTDRAGPLLAGLPYLCLFLAVGVTTLAYLARIISNPYRWG